MRIINLANFELESWREPQWLVVFTTQIVSTELIGRIRARYPQIKIFGLSSFHGVFSPLGFNRGTFGLVVESDDHLDMEMFPIDLSQQCDARLAVKNALIDRPNPRKPVHVIMHATCGFEERIIEGIHDVFDPDVDIYGATAAHDKFLNQSFVFYNEQILYHGVLLMLVYDQRFYCAFETGGYLPTLKTGMVTSAHGRIIETIDNRPAAEVYNEWTDGMFDFYVKRGGELPRSAALYPLGQPFITPYDTSLRLSHPSRVNAQTLSIELFSEHSSGSPIMLMRGSADFLVEQADNTFAHIIHRVEKSSILGALIMYCAGCALAVAENMPRIFDVIKKTLGDIPFLGCSSYGEQGRIKNVQCDCHGNMMIVVLLILRDNAEETASSMMSKIGICDI